MNVGDIVEVIPEWWSNRGFPPKVTVAKISTDPKFPIAISVGDGRCWAMAAHELRTL